MKYWWFWHGPFPQNTNRTTSVHKKKTESALFWTAEGAETTPPPSFRRLSSGLTWLDGKPKDKTITSISLSNCHAWVPSCPAQLELYLTWGRFKTNMNLTWIPISQGGLQPLEAHPSLGCRLQGALPITAVPNLVQHPMLSGQHSMIQLHNSLIRIWGSELEYFECKCTSNKEKTINSIRTTCHGNRSV